MNKEMLVAMSGKMASGKSTLAKGLKEDFGFHIISIGSTIKKVSTLLINDPLQLKEYLAGVLRSEKEFEQVFADFVGKFKDNFTFAEWKKDSNGEYIKNQDYRDLTQFVASHFRSLYGEDIWVRFVATHAMNLAAESERVVCDDLRLPSEKKIFEMFGFISIRLDISQEEQKRRLDKEYGVIEEQSLNHVTETALDEAYFDYRCIVDDKDVSDTRNEIYSYLKLI